MSPLNRTLNFFGGRFARVSIRPFRFAEVSFRRGSLRRNFAWPGFASPGLVSPELASPSSFRRVSLRRIVCLPLCGLVRLFLPAAALTRVAVTPQRRGSSLVQGEEELGLVAEPLKETQKRRRGPGP